MRHFVSKAVREPTDRTPDELDYRRACCIDFGRRLRKLKLPIRRFAVLADFPIRTVYTWTLTTVNCIPPHPAALRTLTLMEIDPSVIETLSRIARGDLTPVAADDGRKQ
jgi:hypothetical protein